MFGAGSVFDELLDQLHDAGFETPRWTHRKGTSGVRLTGATPAGPYDYVGSSLDNVAQGVIDCELTAPESARIAAQEGKI